MKYVYLILLLILSGCKNNHKINKRDLILSFPIKKKPTPSQESPPITIFIHGTKLIRHPQFHRLFNGKPSLIRICTIDQKENVYTSIARLSQSCPENYPFKHCYLFGWSGKLSSNERYTVASILHKEIVQLTKNYKKKYACDPKINIIAHSHGSNIALNLGVYALKKSPFYCINALTLLACPVQIETMRYIASPLFLHVYALYSSLDIVQIIAPQLVLYTYTDKKGNTAQKSYYIPRLSSRKFPHHKKLIQSRIKINGHAIGHKTFASSWFLQTLPHIIEELSAWKNESSKTAMKSKENVLRVKIRKKRL